MVFSVTLSGGTPWGFRLQGGREFNEPIRIAKINPNSKAYNEGIQVGDYVDSINGQKAKGLEHQSAQQLIKAATDQLVLELTRVGSSPNGIMNGDIHNHIDHELEILNSGDRRPSKFYKPVSFTHQQSHQVDPMTVTVNTKKVKSRTAPASPVLQRQFRTAPASPVMFQSVLKIPPLSPRSTNKHLGSRLTKNFINTDDMGSHWPTTPPSSCPSTPPRPRLPKHFKPTPFLPRDSPPPVLPRHLTEHTESDTSLPHYEAYTPSPPLRQRTFLSDISTSSNESLHRFRPVIPSPKQLRRTYFRDFSSGSAESLSESQPMVLSQQSLRKTFHGNNIAREGESDTDSKPFQESVKTLREKFFQDLLKSNVDGTTKSEIIVPPTKSVHSIIENFTAPSEKIKSDSRTPKAKELKTKIPPPVSPKPVRKKLIQTNVDKKEQINAPQKMAGSAFLQIGSENRKDEETKKSTVVSTKPDVPMASKKIISQELKQKNEADQVKPSSKFWQRRKLFDFSSDNKDGSRKSRSVPSSPKLTLRQFWREYTPSSDGGSDSARPMSESKKKKPKKSKGLNLFGRMQRKLLDVGIPDTDHLDRYRSQQQTFGGPSAAERNVSPWSLPIKIESHKKQAFNSPPSRSYSLDSPRSYDSPRSQPQNVFPPPRDFASGQSELPREIPVVLEGINEGLRSLRQVPVEVDQGQGTDLARSVNIERSPIQRALLREQYSSAEMDGKQKQHSPGQFSSSTRRDIPIQIKRGPVTSQTSVESVSKLDCPRQIPIEQDKKKIDLEKRRIDLERDINNVIYDAIRQVPIYDKDTKQEIKPVGKYPNIDPPPYGAQQSEYIVPSKVESQREKRVEEAIQHQLETDRKGNLQKEWEDMHQDESLRSYTTLPMKKKISDHPNIQSSKQRFETEAGSYATLPSFGHKVKRSGSPKLQRKIVYDEDMCFSDIEGGRGKAQPSWRPMHSALQSRHVWKPNFQSTEEPTPTWAPATSPDKQRKDFGMSRVPLSRSLSESKGQYYSQVQDQPEARAHRERGFIPIQVHHEHKPRKVGDTSYEDEKDSSLSSFTTMDMCSEPKRNGTQPPIKSSPKPGVWKPGIQHSPPPAPVSTEKSHRESEHSPLQQEKPRWTPGGPASSSPKGYRPIKADFSKAPSNISAITAPESFTKSVSKTEESYAWKPTQKVAPTATESLPTSAFSYQPPSQHASVTPTHQVSDKQELDTSSSSQVETSASLSQPPVQNGIDHHVSKSMLHLKDEPSRLPPSQSPYITLLQKNRDDEEVLYYTGGRNESQGQTIPQGQENGCPKGIEFVGDPILVTEEGKIPKGAIYLGKSESMEGDVKHTDTYYAVPSDEKPNVVTTTTVSSPKRYEDIGPIDEESGMPLSFRQNVEEEKQHDWYKQMYKSLHRTKKKEGTNSYKPTYQWPDDDDKSDTKSVDVTNTETSTSESITKSEESKSYFALASPKGAGALSPRSADTTSLSPASFRSADFSKSSDFSPKYGEKSSSSDYKSHSAINDTVSTQFSKVSKSDKEKIPLSSVSESLRRDAKFPSGKQNKSDEVFLESKSDDEQDINPYRPSYEKPSRSVRGDISSGYLSEPEYRSKMRSKPSSNVSKTSRALDIGTLPTDLEEFIKYLDEWSPPSARSTLEVYRNQPRSIVNYEPGFSSIAFRESKTQRSDRPKSYTGLSPAEREKLAKKRSRSLRKVKAGIHNPPPDLPGQYSTYTEGRQRYVSEPSINSHDIVDQPDAYKNIQKGGEIPIKGLQKPAPQKSPNNIQSQEKSSNEPIKTSETNHQKITKSQTVHLQSYPTARHNINDTSVYRTNGPILSGYVPSPPVRNPLRISIPSSKPSRSQPRRSTQSAAEQLGIKSPPPGRVNGAFRHLTTDELRSQHRPSNKDQRRREEEEAYRKRRLEQIYEEERRKKLLQQQADIESRKHSDFLLPSQKSPIPNDRFEYGTVPEDRRRGFKIQGKARGMYNFTAQNSRELSFRKGDVVYLIRQIDSNWFEGEKNGRVGIFPVNYVEVLTSIQEASSAAQQSEGQARAKYSFNSQTSVELPLRKGEIVTLLRNVDDNWFEGRVGNRQGIFPVAYVEVLQEPSTPLVTPAPSVITTPMTGRGTPEMLSPVSYDGAPTPPPQPSPGAFTSQLDYLGNRYATSPRDHHLPQQQQENRISSLSNEQISAQRFDGVKSQRPHDYSTTHMNGGYSSLPQHVYSDFSVRSRQSPQQIRKDNPPSLNITAKSVSTPNINLDSSSRNYSNKQDEDLAIARYRAIYAYKPQNEDELELLEGDEIYVMEKCDDGWYVGTSGRTGMFGTFPGNYVTRSQ